MIAIKVKFLNFDDVEQEKVCHFHLSKTEVAKLDIKYGGVKEYTKKLQENNDNNKLYEFIEDVVFSAYGVRKGDAFVKNEEILEQYKYTNAHEAVMIQMLEQPNGTGLSKFFMGCMSAESKKAIAQEAKHNPEMKSQLYEAGLQSCLQ